MVHPPPRDGRHVRQALGAPHREVCNDRAHRDGRHASFDCLPVWALPCAAPAEGQRYDKVPNWGFQMCFAMTVSWVYGLVVWE